MKKYEVYQCLKGEEMSDRDKKEEHSKFWGVGKWNNFVLPFLPKDGTDQILIDMGCNKGLFLQLAEDMGFVAIGVDSNPGAIESGKKWRDEHGYKYDLRQFGIEHCIDTLPMADYTVLANAHYYFTVNDWLEYVDKLQYKTRFVIIVTDEKHHLNRCWASADIEDVRSVFKNWDEVGHIGVLSQNDPSPRKLQAVCFKSRFIERVPIEQLDASNHVQDEFWKEIDAGKSYKDTRYYRILVKYRKNWEPGRLDTWFQERIRNYESIKKDGLRTPLIVERTLVQQKDKQGILQPPKYRILDGNHRYSGLLHLGYKSVFVRKI